MIGTSDAQQMSAPAIADEEGDDTRLDTMTLPALRIVRAPTSRATRRARRHDDRWLVALLLCAAVASIAAAWWSYQARTILLYGDAHSHLLIARRVLDGLQPGLAQLGNVWLPLPHVIMIPFAAVDGLWRTGLAGTFTSMPCYIVAAVYVYLTARRLTGNAPASFIGSLVFVLNPNILYLQTTPLSEPLLFATLTAASYYFVAWAQDDSLRDLLLAAFATLLATLSRYDGWALYLAMLALLVLICWRKGLARQQTVAYVILFGTLGGVGIALWFVWNTVIFGSPFAFLSGSYSSQAQTMYFINHGLAGTYHDLWQSIRSYALATAESVGPVIFALGTLGVGILLWRRRLSADAIAAISTLVPFAFYVVAFFLGQDVMYVPHANYPPFYIFYNSRFGAEMVAPAAIFVAVLADAGKHRASAAIPTEHMGWLPRTRTTRLLGVMQASILALMLGQTALVAHGGTISLQDGQVGASCYPARNTVAFLAQHYDGGRVLIDAYHSSIDLSSAGVAFRNAIYEGDGASWDAALTRPDAYVNWIVTRPNDLVTQRIDIHSAEFRAAFTLVATDSSTSISLWHRADAPPYPTRPLADDVITPYLACSRSK